MLLDIPSIDRSSPDGQEFEQLLPAAKEELETKLAQLEQLETQLSQLERDKRTEADQHGRQLADWEAKVAAMEESLELMRTEFESMEDYWQKKLEDERVFYEEQLRRNEDQFRELEARMRDYEALLDSGGGGGGDVGKKEEEEEGRFDQRRRGGHEEEEEDDDKLSTIEESSSMEQQVTAWEEEIAALREQLEQLEEVHAQQLEQLEEAHAQQVGCIEADHAQRLQRTAETHEQELTAMQADWQSRLTALEGRLAEDHKQPLRTTSKSLSPSPPLASPPPPGDVWRLRSGGSGHRSLSHTPLQSQLTPRQERRDLLIAQHSGRIWIYCIYENNQCDDWYYCMFSFEW